MTASLLAFGTTAEACQGSANALALSGLCKEDATQKLGAPSELFTKGLAVYGCRPDVAETKFGQDKVLLYWASKCKAEAAELVLKQTGDAQELYIAGGGMNSTGKPIRLATLLNSGPGATSGPLLDFVHKNMRKSGVSAPDAFKSCRAFPATSYAKDAWVVDAPKGYTAANGATQRGCGSFGYSRNNRSFWRVADGHSWFFQIGKNGYTDFDPITLSIVSVSKPAPAPTPAPKAPAAPVASKPVSQGLAVTAASAPPFSGPANIAGTPGINEQFYDQARDYAVFSGSEGGNARYCVAERDFSGLKLRIGFDGGQWQLALPVSSEPDYYGQLEIDGRAIGMSGTASNSWTIAWIGRPELDAIKAGSLMIMDIGRHSFDFPLNGSTAAILKIEECTQRLR
ncbi:MAG: hypothetical protein ACRBB0_08870 [Pelagimonas sp.]|uniref:hypothetical protein n=1 Tax=Pelagimonas sp. TaxID=2073170 RepID=UPI003D6A173C